jgi:glycosyltransferase involved in cell wall biosynthesis
VEKFATGADPSILPELQSRSSELVIGTISGLRQVKRIDRLIRAFAALPPDIRACLVIVGDGPERTRLEEIAAEVGIADRTFFTGNIAAPERVFGLFDVFALTSDSEQMPYALIEAMAAGLPIVATDVGDVKAIVAPENRPLIVPSASVDALISALCELARNARQRRVLGYHNQEKARREFGAATMMKTYEALFAGTLQ